MKIEKTMLIAMVSLIVAAGIFMSACHFVRAEEEGSEDVILKKLDEVLKNQKAILDEIELLKSELNIVKIRVTQKQ